MIPRPARRTPSLLAVVVLFLVTAIGGPGAATAADRATQPRTAMAQGTALAIAAQTATIGLDEPFAIDLTVLGGADTGELVFQRHEPVDRLGLARAIAGDPGPTAGAPATRSIGATTPVHRWTFTTTTGGDLPIDEPGVYPVSIGPEGDPLLVTFIVVRATRPAAVRVTPFVAVNARPALQPDGSTTIDPDVRAQLERLVDLAGSLPDIPLAIELPPETMGALFRVDQGSELIEGLAGLGPSTSILASSYVPVSTRGWAELDGAPLVVSLQERGAQSLTDLFGDTVTGIARIDRDTGPAELDLLAQAGVRHLLIDDPDLATAFDEARLVSTSEGDEMATMAIDPLLAEHLGSSSDPLLAAYQAIAELTLIGSGRTSPADVVLDLTELLDRDALAARLLLEELDATRGLTLTALEAPLDGLLEDAARGTITASPLPETVGHTTVDAAFATDRAEAEAAVIGYEAMLGGPHPATIALFDLIDVAAHRALDAGERRAYLGTVVEAIGELSTAVSMPEGQRIGLTERRAEVPIVIENELTTAIDVTLLLTGDTGIEFPEGTARNARLEPGSNRVEVPIRARASGESLIRVEVRSPEPERRVALAENEVRIRTTALSGLGVVLFVGALLVLLIWWFRQWRARGRTPTD